MNYRELSYDAGFELAKGAVAAGTGDTQTFTEVDMLGFDSLLTLVLLGAITATGTATLTVKGSDTAATYGAGTVDTYKDVDGNVLSAAADDTMSNKILLIDLHRLPRRYARGQLARATANVVIVGAVSIKYNGRQKPITQASVIGASSTYAGPVPSTT